MSGVANSRNIVTFETASLLFLKIGQVKKYLSFFVNKFCRKKINLGTDNGKGLIRKYEFRDVRLLLISIV